MASAAFYRAEAKRARAAAVAATDPETGARWLRIAKDYDALAEATAGEETKESARITTRVPMQQQPVQQQQSKIGSDDK
jgi:hypothetical protein